MSKSVPVLMNPVQAKLNSQGFVERKKSSARTDYAALQSNLLRSTFAGMPVRTRRPPAPDRFESSVRTMLWWGGRDSKDRSLSASKQSQIEEAVEDSEMKQHFSQEQSFDSDYARDLSPAAIDCIEQFSRLNGLTGKKMRTNFESNAPPRVKGVARNLVEYTCFRYLARCNSDHHPLLKDAAFRRLTFSAMLAWQRPYKDDIPEDGTSTSERHPKKGLVGEEAFVRIAPTIAGVADRPTVHHLYKTLVLDSEGLSYDLWDRYLVELCRIHQEIEQERPKEHLGLESGEIIICIGSKNRQAVQKWNNNIAWPGRLTLTNKALYFEGIGIMGHQKSIKLDLTGPEAKVEGRKVGPLGLEIFDSAICVSAGPTSESWVLEFVDFTGERGRDIWHAIVNEIISSYTFIEEYGPKDEDPLLNYIYGARNGRNKAIASAVDGIARLQAVQVFLGKVPLHPEKFLQFSYLKNASGGDLVLQTLAVGFWAGRMEIKANDLESLANSGSDSGPDDAGAVGPHLLGTDGTVYLRNWMMSPSWKSGKATTFWKQKDGNKGLVLSKSHVVGGLSQTERAVRICKDQSQIIEKTQATIDGALLKGVPDNLNLLQELILPLSIAGGNFQKLRKWDNPGATATLLTIVYGIIYLKWLQFVIPAVLLGAAAAIFVLRVFKAHGNLGSEFGKVTIQGQPETNTIQKIMALKEALDSLERFLQACNISLLKLRTVALGGSPQTTNYVPIALATAGVALIVVPARILLALFILDQFTVELPFRRESFERVLKVVQDWWSLIPAAPIVLLPPEKIAAQDSSIFDLKSDKGMDSSKEADSALQVAQALSGWLGDEVGRQGS